MWIAAEFQKAGVKPGYGDSYLQPVPLVEFRTSRTSSLTISRSGKKLKFQAPAARVSFPIDGTRTGELVFAGFGITAPELHYDDYANINAKGKIVVVFDHEPQETLETSVFNGKGNTRYANNRSKMFNAVAHGAIAMMVIPDPLHPTGAVRPAIEALSGLPPRTGRPTQAIDGEASIPVINADASISAELFRTAGKTAADVQRALDLTLKPQTVSFSGATGELSVTNEFGRRGRSYNVLGIVEGTDPMLKQETIVYSAHFDHDGLELDGSLYPGADDNGSGTVGVVALARALAASKPKRSLLLAVFAAEERGLLGSYYYTENPTRPLASTRAVINFDMIGRNETPSKQTDGLIEIAADTSNEVNVVGLKYSPDYRSAVERANRQVDLRISTKWDEDTVVNVLFRSDQYPFLLHNIPAMWWFTGFHPDYHQITDTADRINYSKMEKILKLAALTGLDFASSEKPPAFLSTGAPTAK